MTQRQRRRRLERALQAVRELRADLNTSAIKTCESCGAKHFADFPDVKIDRALKPIETRLTTVLKAISCGWAVKIDRPASSRRIALHVPNPKS